MRHNGRPVLVASELPPNLLMLYPGAAAGAGVSRVRDVARASARNAARPPRRGRCAPLPWQRPARPD